MKVARLLCGLTLVAVVLPFEVVGAEGVGNKPLVRMYDRNGDGKLGPKEDTAARPARAQLRVMRGLRRNAAVIKGIR